MFPMFVYGDIVFNEEDLEKNSRNPEFLLTLYAQTIAVIDRSIISLYLMDVLKR